MSHHLRSRSIAISCLQLARELLDHSESRTARQLTDAIGVSRATLYRRLDDLADAGWEWTGKTGAAVASHDSQMVPIASRWLEDYESLQWHPPRKCER